MKIIESDIVYLNPDLGMFESIRDMGYSVENAIADLIDNSLAAKSTQIHVDIVFDKGNSYIRIEDNGTGMDRDRLNDALTFGKKIKSTRDSDDLGRFGLGLKTASLSQGKRLSVKTVINEKAEIGVWDTDFVNNVVQGWAIKTQPFESTTDLLKQKLICESGTIIVIEILDKLLNEKAEDSDLFYKKIDAVGDHLSLIFHRYIQGYLVKKTNIFYQGNQLKPIDPFAFSKITIKGEGKYYNNSVVVKAYILPHESKMSKADLKKASLENGFTFNQGFYLYRTNRLIVCGGWLNMGDDMKSVEPTKLCRIMVDIPNEWDEVWGIDVKKSKAIIPNSIYSDVEKIVKNAYDSSKDRYIHRSKRKISDTGSYSWIWEARKSVNGKVYKINRKHPLIDQISEMEEKKDFDGLKKLLFGLIDHIEINLPITEIISDGAMNQADLSDVIENNREKLKKVTANFRKKLMDQGKSEEFINNLLGDTDLI